MSNFKQIDLDCGCRVYEESRTPTKRCEMAQKAEDALLKSIDRADKTGDWIAAQAVDRLLTRHYRPDEVSPDELDRRLVRALNHMEHALYELSELRTQMKRQGPTLDAGEAELWKAYNIISAKRPIKK